MLRENAFLFSSKKIEKNKEKEVIKVPDESNNFEVAKLKVRQPVIGMVEDKKKETWITKEEGGYERKKVLVEKDFTQEVQDQIDYYSRTSEIESEGERVKILQDIADKMTAGLGFGVKVVILAKGEEERAFIFPEGTIMISQSILNTCTGLDHVAAIIAHEIMHFKNKTFENTISHNDALSELSIGALHETVADLSGVSLAEKAGFNTWAVAEKMDELEGRGLKHQEGGVRAAQVVGGHLVVDRETSEKDITPVPDILRREIRKKNLEIIREAIKEFNFEQFKEILPKLHPRDLYSVIYELKREIDFYPFIHHQEEQGDKRARSRKEKDSQALRQEFIKIFNDFFNFSLDLIEGRIPSETDPVERSSFLYSLTSRILGGSENWWILDRKHPLDGKDAVINIMKKLDQEPEMGNFSELNRNIFSVENAVETKQSSFFESLKPFDEKRFSAKTSLLLLSEDDVLDILEEIVKSQEGKDPYKIISMQKIFFFIEEYLENKYLFQKEKDKDVNVSSKDQERIRNFFRQAYERKLVLDKQWLEGNRNNIPENGYSIGLYVFHQTEYRVKHQNQKLLFKIAQEFAREKEDEERTTISEEDIDNFFLDLERIINKEQSQPYGEEDKTIKSLSQKLNKAIIDNPGLNREKLYGYIEKRIDQFDFSGVALGVKEFLKTNKANQRKNQPSSEELKLIKFIYKMNFALMTLGTQFEGYKKIEEITRTSGIDWQDYDFGEMQTLFKPVLASLNNSNAVIFFPQKGYSSVYTSFPGDKWENLNKKYSAEEIKAEEKRRSVRRFEAISQLSFIRDMVEKMDKPKSDNLSELEKEWKKFLVGFGLLGGGEKVSNYEKDKINLFNGNLPWLIFSEKFRSKAMELIRKALEDEEKIPEVYEFVNQMIPDSEFRRNFLREIRKKYLISEDAGLEEKTDFLLKHIEDVGLEGARIVGDQVNTFKEYEKFSQKTESSFEKYLSGENSVEKIWALDLISSYFSREWEHVFESCSLDKKTRSRVSEDLASFYLTKSDMADLSTGKNGERVFSKNKNIKTLREIISILQNLNEAERIGIVLKALAGKNGAFSNAKNREKLGELLIVSLGTNNRFVAEFLKAACRKGDRKLLSFPVAKMVSGLLFRGLDVKEINVNKLKKRMLIERRYTVTEKIVSKVKAQGFVEVMLGNQGDIQYGHNYGDNQSDLLVVKAREMDGQYKELERIFKEYFENKKRAEEGNNKEEEPEIDPSIEAMIRACENSAIAVRSLQMAVQIMKFSPSVEKRLSRCLDSNEAVDKITFWKNLKKLSEGDGEDGEEIRSFLDKVSRIGKKAGGGSMFTTHFAEMDNNGKKENVVLKMLNPNTVKFIVESYKLFQDSLDEVIKNSKGEDKRSALLGKTLLALAKRWCLADINYADFLKDDSEFRTVIDKFNQQAGREAFYAPEVKFESRKLKSEQAVSGTTLNRFLNDESNSAEDKQKAVSGLDGFFAHQFQDSSAFEDENSEKYYRDHSDPQTGNYMVDNSSGEIKTGVIDRNMYLRLSQREKDVFARLFKDDAKSGKIFLSEFLDLVLDSGKERGVNKQSIKRNILFKVGWEKIKGGSDNFSLLRRAMACLAENDYDIPLAYWLTIRNIKATKELALKYELKHAGKKI
jgi:hypothetical protein